jgi:hypothetical protein
MTHGVTIGRRRRWLGSMMGRHGPRWSSSSRGIQCTENDGDVAKWRGAYNELTWVVRTLGKAAVLAGNDSFSLQAEADDGGAPR